MFLVVFGQLNVGEVVDVLQLLNLLEGVEILIEKLFVLVIDIKFIIHHVFLYEML